MKVVSNSPLRVTSLRWQAQRGQWAVTVIAKATYRLAAGTCALAEEQEDPNEHENHWDDDPRRSLYSPSDLVPFKPAPEVMLVGNAFAPRGEPVTKLTARLVVGKVDKSIVVHGDRTFLPDGSLRPSLPFRRMALRYERAAGGPGTANPVGVPRAMSGGAPLPNLEPPGLNVMRPSDVIEPIGFAPIAVDWPARRDRLGAQAGAWSQAALATDPVPEWLDQRFFMSAPADQQLDELRPHEQIVLENLHPDHERLVASLAGWEPRAIVERPRAPAVGLPMTCDTLWIDTDRAICTLTWRGHLALDDRDQEGRVVVGMEVASRPPARSEARAAEVREKQAPPRMAPPQPPRAATLPVISPQVWPAWLASKEGESSSPSSDALRGLRPAEAQAPKEGAAPPSLRPEPPKPPPPPPGMTAPVMSTAPRAPTSSGVGWLRSIPAASPDGAAPPAAAPPPPFAPPAAIAPPPAMAAPPAMAPIAPPAAIAPPPAMAPIAPPPAMAPIAPPAMAPMASSAFAPSPDRPGSSLDLREIATRGVAAVSNAAAGGTAARPSVSGLRAVASAEIEPASVAANGALRLVWFDEAAVPRIRRVPRWKPLLAALESAPLDRELDDPAAEADPMLVEDRREVFEIAARAKATDARGVSAALDGAIRADGKLVPPIVLVSGEVETPFDEMAHLEASIAAATPLVTSDDRELEASIETAQRFLKNRGTSSVRATARALSTRIREAFAKEKKLSLDLLDAHVSRALREERCFQRREVLGEKHLRLLLRERDDGGPRSSDDAPLVLYAPEAVAKKLPMYTRFSARMIAEVHLQEDEAETAPHALRVLALVRFVERSRAT
ncbi:Hypothetical protein A7982_05049 [Minicystis rosea]|nr:Hypothetical protein A7982_05049 [Minicystis rosea]